MRSLFGENSILGERSEKNVTKKWKNSRSTSTDVNQSRAKIPREFSVLLETNSDAMKADMDGPIISHKNVHAGDSKSVKLKNKLKSSQIFLIVVSH